MDELKTYLVSVAVTALMLFGGWTFEAELYRFADQYGPPMLVQHYQNNVVKAQSLEMMRIWTESTETK